MPASSAQSHPAIERTKRTLEALVLDEVLDVVRDLGVATLVRHCEVPSPQPPVWRDRLRRRLRVIRISPAERDGQHTPHSARRSCHTLHDRRTPDPELTGRADGDIPALLIHDADLTVWEYPPYGHRAACHLLDGHLRRGATCSAQFVINASEHGGTEKQQKKAQISVRP